MTAEGGLDQPRWSVGALAKVAGMTVRTLHHYDELGLLRPSERTPSGHRRYTEGDLHRLYQIRLLRQLGMSLEEIGGVLADSVDPGPLARVLAGHLEQLDEQVWRLNALRRQTRGLLAQLNGPTRPDSDRLLALLGSTTIFDQRLTREQRDFLDRHAVEIGPRARERLDEEWPEVLAKVVEHYRAGDPVDDPEVRRTARRLVDVGETFAAGDREILREMWAFFRENGRGVLRDVLPGQPVDDLGDGLWDYVARMYAALSNE
ncbi:MerR family transcriptional regulator [Saccharothrix sp. S26]|uniref:MerR family transcriptional regulator n=1 Tax=Saccharothrix sp. S26 TaxID=2907215 RepID=UPI001F3970A7|nr:MerR family transcriptional regulator [Saccharothrix sp. S26]MCE6994719.1 MerR family transcriptional regulator [Saccharothrix sp. S26]